MFIITIFTIVMKKLNGLKKINMNFTNSINELYSDLQTNLKEIKQEYQENIIDEKIKLLVTICQGEGLNLSEMKIKYLKQKEIYTITPEKLNENIIIDNLLDKIRIDDQDYYYEACQDGIVFNASNEQVGIFKNGKVSLGID